MFSHKFKKGDKIVVKNSGVRGTISICYVQGDVNMYVVQLANGIENDYSESEIKFYVDIITQNKELTPEIVGKKCPKCRTPWTVTRFGSRVWYDCKSCNKKAESLISSLATKKEEDEYDLFNFLDTSYFSDPDDDFWD